MNDNRNIDEIDEIVRKNMIESQKYDYGELLKMLAYSNLSSRAAVVALLASLNDNKLESEEWQTLLEVAAKLLKISVTDLLGYIKTILSLNIVPAIPPEMETEMQAMAEEREKELQSMTAAEIERFEQETDNEEECPYSDEEIEALMSDGIPYEEDDPAWFK